MDELRSRAVVVASAEVSELGRFASECLSKEKLSVDFRLAADTLIPDLASGGVYLFGASAEEDLENGDYKELYRSFQGVNFAGRHGAFFTVGDGKVFKKLKRMLKDSGLTILEPGFVMEGDYKDSFGSWLKRILKAVPAVPGQGR
jgi:hypothetical protein